MNAATRAALALAWPALAFATAFLLPRLAQDPAYHQYADPRALLGLPNFWNVASNAAIAAAGVCGLGVLAGARPRFHTLLEGRLYAALFVIVLGNAVGSVYYHAQPATPALFWDRLPIAVTLALLTTITVAERAGPAAAQRVLLPALLAGAAGVSYWSYTEAIGRGDLTFYFAFQAACLGGFPILWALYRRRYTGSFYYAAALLIYAAALGCEFADRPLYAALGMGGHAIKHGLAGVALAMLPLMLLRRAPLGAEVHDAGHGVWNRR
jgi:hypothetical protein